MADGYNPRPSMYPPIYGEAPRPIAPPRLPDPSDPYPVYPPPVPDDAGVHSFRYPPYRPPGAGLAPGFDESGNSALYPPPSLEQIHSFHPPGHSQSFSAPEAWAHAPEIQHSYSERVDLPLGQNPYQESQGFEHLKSHGHGYPEEIYGFERLHLHDRKSESPRHSHQGEESHGFEHFHSHERRNESSHHGHHREESPGFEHVHSHGKNNISPHHGRHREESPGFEHFHSHGRSHESPQRSHRYPPQEETHAYQHFDSQGRRDESHHESPQHSQRYPPYKETQPYEHLDSYSRRNESLYESPQHSQRYPPPEETHAYEHLDSHSRHDESRYESPQHSHLYPPHLLPNPSQSSHHREGSFGPDRSKHSHRGANGPVVKIFCKAKPEFNLALRHDGVVLVPADKHDESQQWIWDQSWSTRVKDVTGQPAFALVNKASNEALKHAKEAFQQVLTAYYPPTTIDESILWTQSEDMGEGYRTIRKANDITLNLDALKGDKKSGGVREGTPAILFKWKKQENQLWRIIPL